MISIRYAELSDEAYWFTLDTHLPKAEFVKKVGDKMAYVLLDGDTPVGVMRYQLFWDSIPFLTLILIDPSYRRNGIGREVMRLWEKEMRQRGHGMCLVSTQVNEDAQHFYRRLGYKDCGCLMVDIPGYEQPMEMFLSKALI